MTRECLFSTFGDSPETLPYLNIIGGRICLPPGPVFPPFSSPPFYILHLTVFPSVFYLFLWSAECFKPQWSSPLVPTNCICPDTHSLGIQLPANWKPDNMIDKLFLDTYECLRMLPLCILMEPSGHIMPYPEQLFASIWELQVSKHSAKREIWGQGVIWQSSSSQHTSVY